MSTNIARIALLGGLGLAALAGGYFMGSSVAEARERSGSVTTARGKTYESDTSRSCADGSCTRSKTVTGPNGKTASRTGTATKTGDGSYSTSHQATGPNGGTVQRSGTVTTTPPATTTPAN